MEVKEFYDIEVDDGALLEAVHRNTQEYPIIPQNIIEYS